MKRSQDSWDRGHEYGWDLYRGKQKLAELHYLHIEGLCHLFQLRAVQATDEEIGPLFALRPPDPAITLRNRLLPGVVIHDQDFCMYSPDLSIVSLKDFRAGPS